MQGIFLGTFLIGLREGLEATLIVSIVGAFLKRSGYSMRPMFLGVGLAVALSIAVGVGLNVLSAALPQQQQEMLETVIGAVAVVFVTTMIIWMNQNASQLKGELESEAQQAITRGGSLALAGMAFLAVLKEGFETAVFLLAAIQATGGSGALAIGGAVLGIGASIAIGVGIYFGGVKLNLSRFFRITGVFLILVAAGLVMSTLRTAHEAAWVVIGQQQVFDLSSWMPTTSVLGAFLTGMFGIRTDMRLIEVLGWLLYAIPVLLIFLWPARWGPSPLTRRRPLVWTATGLAVVALGLVTLVPASGVAPPGAVRTAADASGNPLTLTLGPEEAGSRALTIASGTGTSTVRLEPAGEQTIDGVAFDVWQAKVPADPGQTAAQVTLGELATLAGGRLPVGLNVNLTPGPFAAQWGANTVYTALASADSLVGADAVSSRVVTLSGGGLVTSKTVSVGGLGSDWSIPTDDTDAAAASIAGAALDRAERMLWRAWLPALFALAAATLALVAIFSGRKAPEERKETTALC